MATSNEHGVLLSQTSPAFLHGNSTSHTWAFSAVAELIDNSYDPDVSAQCLWIDKKDIYAEACLIFMDNGSGMYPEKLHRMLSFGYCDKVEIKGHKPVGHYGNGFKSGSMRLGKDAIVFTKKLRTLSVGFLSQTYLNDIKAETVLVPIVSWDAKTKKVIEKPNSKGSLQAITRHSLFKSEIELLMEFESLAKYPTGTRIVIYNLKRGSDGKLELDLDSNPHDIINSEHQELDLSNTSTAYRPIREYCPEYKQSLREYCSILFLKPRMKIFLRGSKVKTKLISKSLSRTETDVYRPMWLQKPVKIIFGFGPSDNDFGLMMYHRNRLIKAYEKVGVQKQQSGQGKRVVGIVEVDFLEPIHNKQDFNKTDRYNSCMTALGQKLNDYWNEKTNQGAANNPVQIRPDWQWAQCDNCLKWRRLPDGVNESLPDKWFCFNNQDVTHNRCDIDEEPEDEDWVLQKGASYKKIYKKMKEGEKQQKRQRIEDKARQLEEKEEELKKIQENIVSQMNENLAKGPSGVELNKAKQALEEAKRREQSQKKIIEQLRVEKEKIEKHQLQMHGNMLLNAKNLNGLAKNTTPSGSSVLKRKSGKASTPTKKLKMVDVEENYVVEENSSSEDEAPAASTQTPVRHKSTPAAGLKIKLNIPKKPKDVILVDSGSESDSGNETNRAVSPVEIKPDIDALNKDMDQSEVPMAQRQESSSKGDPITTNASTPGTSATKTGLPSSPGSHGQSFSMAKSLVHRLVQTLPMDDQSKEMADKTKKEHEEVKQELADTKAKLQNLRTSVSELLKTILPEFSFESLEVIDDIVVEMVRVNATEGETPSNGVNGESHSPRGAENGSGDASTDNSV